MGDRMVKPRRIALVTHSFERGGGVPAVTRWLRESLGAVGGYSTDVHDLATSSRDSSSRRIVAPRTWIRRSLRSPTAHPSGYEHWGANAAEFEVMRYRPRRELSAVLRQYDLIQVIAGSPAWAAAVTGLGVPVVLQVATLVAWERAALLSVPGGPLNAWRGTMTRFTSRIERSALREVDAVLVENAVMLDHARSLGQRHVVKAPPGVDTTFFVPGPEGWRRTGHLLSVCRLGDPRKGLDRTVRAYAEMVRRMPSTPPLVLAGRGVLPAATVALVADLGLRDRVVVRSDVTPVDLLRLYQTASVFVQTSYEEGLGVSVLEAMACALPVVATATAGSRETVSDGETGWLVAQSPESEVPARIADRVLDILADPRCELGLRGRQRCLTNFSTTAALQCFTDTYDKLLS
ncbi:glycosyltransferase [Plantactinospora sonchi]|uniref:Glycosyltransferase n=1 Tax=Plantactinospora sonchi TaxID=1544735 RepID=A0ABU7RRI0_9ACTN